MSDAPFLTGANLPWLLYGSDFGSNAWRPQGGVACLPERQKVAAALEQIAGTGASIVRWFMFCDGRAGIRFDPRGAVSLDDRIFADLDCGLELVAAAGLKVLPVLFDFSWCRRAKQAGGVQVAGRRQWFVNETLRRALIDGVVRPIARRYGQHRAVWGWDIINEPEWITYGVGNWNPIGTLSDQAMRRFLRDIASTLRAQAEQPVTVGLASARGLSLVREIGLDLYQVHWYDHLEKRAPLATPVSAFGLDRPIFLGEFPTRGSRRSTEDILAIARQCGYAAALGWSSLATDRATDGRAMAEAMTAFRKQALNQSTHAVP
jgi:hypothetical protein